MSATLTINSSSTWWVKTGIFLVTMELIAAALKENNRAIPEELEGLLKYQASYLTISDFTPKQFSDITNAMLTVYRRILQNWSEHPFDDRGYWYIHDLSILKTLLINDQRLSGMQDEDECLITVEDQRDWSASRLIFEFIVENMIAWLRSNEADEIADQLLNYSETCHILIGNKTTVEMLRPLVKYLYEKHVTNYRHIHNAEWFQEALAPKLVELYEIFDEASS